MSPPVAIFGMGRFGRALACALESAGRPPAAIGGRGKPHARTHTMIEAPDSLVAALQHGTVLVLAVRDDALPALAAKFAGVRGIEKLAVVHTSGASGPGVLKPLADAGVQTGVFHILQSLPPDKGERRIPGSYAAIAGPPELVEKLREVGHAIGAHPIELKPDQWAPYHAAAVLASNALLGLLDVAVGMLRDAGVPSAPHILLPLVKGTLQNADEMDLANALTGPVVRGDAGTIRLHLELLQGDARQAYIAGLRAVLSLARKASRTPQDKLDEIARLLENAK